MAYRGSGRSRPDIFEPFLIEELLPWIEARHAVSAEPAQTVLAGQSLGGLTYAHAARSRPDRFGWIIGQSTSVWWPGDVLEERQYNLRYREYEGGHDFACWRGGLADSLIVALRGPA